MSSGDEAPPGSGRLLTGVAWAILLTGLWFWGREASDGAGGSSAPTTGDVAAVGRPLGVPLPPAREPLAPVGPTKVDIPSIGVSAPVVARGLDTTGAVEPPPFATPDAVGWFGTGTRPGAEGAALFVGHVDTRTEPAVFYGLSAARPGETVKVTRTDGSVAVFTIEDVQVVGRDRFDARKVYGVHHPGRAELRLITCGGTYDKKTASYTANVVVSAYLTDARGI
ncbi:class F sortase [Streptomyces sp. NPDC058992]